MLNVKDLITENAAINDAMPDARQRRLDIHKRVADALWPRLQGGFYQHKSRQSCIAKAFSKPLPGGAEDAFLRGDIKLDPYTVYEIRPIHIKALQAVDSPLLDLLGGIKAEGAIGTATRDIESPEENARICFIFTEEPKSLMRVPKDQLGEYVKINSEKFIDLKLEDFSAIGSAIQVVFNRFAKAHVHRQAQLEGQVEKSFFQQGAERASTPKEQAGSCST